MGAGAQDLEPSSTAFPRHEQEVVSKVEQLEHEPSPIWDAGAAEKGIVTLCHLPAAVLGLPPPCNLVNSSER